MSSSGDLLCQPSVDYRTLSHVKENNRRKKNEIHLALHHFLNIRGRECYITNYTSNITQEWRFVPGKLNPLMPQPGKSWIVRRLPTLGCMLMNSFVRIRKSGLLWFPSKLWACNCFELCNWDWRAVVVSADSIPLLLKMEEDYSTSGWIIWEPALSIEESIQGVHRLELPASPHSLFWRSAWVAP